MLRQPSNHRTWDTCTRAATFLQWKLTEDPVAVGHYTYHYTLVYIIPQTARTIYRARDILISRCLVCTVCSLVIVPTHLPDITRGPARRRYLCVGTYLYDMRRYIILLSSTDDPENHAAASPPPPVQLASVVARTQSVGRPTSRRHIIIASHTRWTRRHALPYLSPTISSSPLTGTGARAPGPHRLEFFLCRYII